MNLYTFLAFATLLILAVPTFFLIRHKGQEQERQSELESRQRDILAVKELDEQLSLCLEMLELPQLEDKKKRLKIARRFRTVLIEKLLFSQVPYGSPT